MLTKVEVRTDQGALLGLPLQDVSEGYIVAEIEGLDSVKATIVSSNFATLDGTQYQSSRREARNVILTLGLEPDYSVGSVQALRNRLYRFFMPKSKVNLSFFTSDSPSVDISGRVESFESKLFTKEPEVKISVLCFDPDFFDPLQVIVGGATTNTTTDMLIDYKGTIETGIEFVLPISRAIPSFMIYNRSADGALSALEFSAPLSIGDVLTISTVSGAKGASVTAAGGKASMLYGISPESNWINLFPGENHIRVYAEGLAVPYVIKYTNKFGGL